MTSNIVDSINQITQHLLQNTSGGTSEQLLSAICQQLNISDITSTLNGRSVYEVSPALFHHMQLQCRVVARIVSSVLSRPIVTIHDLELEIAESEDVGSFSDLKLGQSLTNLPDTRRYFGLIEHRGNNTKSVRPTKSIEVMRFLLKSSAGLCLLWANSDKNQNNAESSDDNAEDVFALVDGFARSVGRRKGFDCGIHIQNLQEFRNLLRTESARSSSIQSLALLVRMTLKEIIPNLIASNQQHSANNQQMKVLVAVPTLKIQACASSATHSSDDLMISLKTNASKSSEIAEKKKSSALVISFGDDDEEESDEETKEDIVDAAEAIPQTQKIPVVPQLNESKSLVCFDKLQRFVYSREQNARENNASQRFIDLNEDIWKSWNDEKKFSCLPATVSPTTDDFSTFETLLIVQSVLHFYNVLVPNSIQEYFTSTTSKSKSNENDEGKDNNNNNSRIRRRKYINPELENVIEDKPNRAEISQILLEKVSSSFPQIIPLHFPLSCFIHQNNNHDNSKAIILYGFGGPNGRHRTVLNKILDSLRKKYNKKRDSAHAIFFGGFCFSPALTIPHLSPTMERALQQNINGNNNNVSFFAHNKFLTYDVIPSSTTDFLASSNFMRGFTSCLVYLEPFLKSSSSFASSPLFLETLDYVMTAKFLPKLQIIGCHSLTVITKCSLASIMTENNKESLTISVDESVSSWFVPESCTLFCNLAGENNNSASVASRELTAGFSTRGSNVCVQLADGIIELMKNEIDFPENPRETLKLLSMLGGKFRETLIDFFSWSLFLSPEILNFEARARGVVSPSDSAIKFSWSSLVKDWTGGFLAAKKFKNVYPVTADGMRVPLDVTAMVKNQQAQRNQKQNNTNNNQNKTDEVIFESGNGLNKIIKFSDDDDDESDKHEDEKYSSFGHPKSGKDNDNNSNPFLSSIQEIVANPLQNSSGDNNLFLTMLNNSGKNRKISKLDQVTMLPKSSNNFTNNDVSIGDEKIRQLVARFAEYLSFVYIRENFLNKCTSWSGNAMLIKVEWINQNEETGMPYDIVETYRGNNNSSTFQMFVEVKSAWRRKIDATNRDFFLTVREFAFAAQNPEKFHVLQIFGTNTFIQFVSDFMHNNKKTTVENDDDDSNVFQQKSYNPVNNNNISKVLENIMNRGKNIQDGKRLEDEKKMIENVHFKRTDKLFESWKKGEVRIEGQLAVRPQY